MVRLLPDDLDAGDVRKSRSDAHPGEKFFDVSEFAFSLQLNAAVGPVADKSVYVEVFCVRGDKIPEADTLDHAGNDDAGADVVHRAEKYDATASNAICVRTGMLQPHSGAHDRRPTSNGIAIQANSRYINAAEL